MDENFDLDTVVVASSDQVSGELQEGDLAILNLKDGIYYGLNSVGSRIWALLQTPISVLQVRDTLLAEYEVDADVCTRELIALLNNLSSKELIKVHAAGE
jgi:Coenzyme PQQ synthesis protein D (PqqD)